MFNRTHAILTGVYFTGIVIISIFKEVKFELYLYSITAFFGIGITLILLKILIEKFESFDKYERLVFILSHPIASLVILMGKMNYFYDFTYFYFSILLFSSGTYLVLSAPYRIREFYFTK